MSSEDQPLGGGVIRNLDDMRKTVPTLGVLASIFAGIFSGGAVIAACIVWVFGSIKESQVALEQEVAARVKAEQAAREEMERRLSSELDEAETRIMERLTHEMSLVRQDMSLIRADLRDLRQTAQEKR